MPRIRVALVALVAAALVAPATASASIIPRSGFYQGWDGFNHLRFYYSGVRKKLEDIIIGGEYFGTATVQGAQWHHTCYAGHLCTRGTWTASHHISGIWNDSLQGGDVHFNAIWEA